MIIASMVALTATASKWLLLGKIMTALGSGFCAAEPLVKGIRKKHHRRSDDELNQDSSGTEKSPKSFQCEQNIPLSSAINCAESTPGVYVLRLNGNVMKCGRASFDKGSVSGVVWRLRQYYNLNYDDRARAGEYWSVNLKNRDKITVSWQCCPVSKCHELEYKLFKKYGKGQWAHRAPNSCLEDSWELLI